ncbi:ADP-ribosylation factor-like protein 5B isoform X1 [Chiroxiphia lanceolata]|uniref:ADP-ribosylation factor-like protein 5B isoform X1 n=1 Tax=Chiroxiphia lanceolata TaxID=296741 RepID=UPI0013CE731B|nr:ADP-ribosylation factor-like protein 5B isoform X1 [Chiroxiphia lanceolata]
MGPSTRYSPSGTGCFSVNSPRGHKYCQQTYSKMGSSLYGSCKETASTWASHGVTAIFEHPPALAWGPPHPAEHKVIIVGLDNAGKTTILYQFLMNEVVHTSPTIGSNVEEIVVKNTHFLMWDIGGQESLRSSWNTYYSNTEFIILVVDSIDRERLSITKEELYRMLAHEDLRKAAVLIFANKQDMKGCMTAAEISTYLTLSSIKDHPWHIQSCCALTGEGLCQGLEWMTSRIGVVKSFSIPKRVILSSSLNTQHTVRGRGLGHSCSKYLLSK